MFDVASTVLRHSEVGNGYGDARSCLARDSQLYYINEVDISHGEVIQGIVASRISSLHSAKERGRGVARNRVERENNFLSIALL